MEHKNDVAILKSQSKKKRKEFLINQIKEGKSKGDSGQFQFQLNDYTSEFDSTLMGRLGSKAFNEMSKSDSIIGGLLSSYNNLILSCNWTLDELVDPTPEEKKAYDVLHDWIFSMNSFEPLLNSILKMLPIGFSVFNRYFTPINYDNSVYMMPVLLERLQQSIYRIDYDKQFVQQTTSKGLLVDIDFSDLVFFTFRKEGNDLRGVSLLRQAYYDWIDKADIKKIAKKGISREMLGLPMGKVPSNVRVDTPEYEEFAYLLDSLSSREYYQTDDSIIIPDGYDLDFFKTEFKIADVKEYLGYYDSSMAISVLAQFILLGQQGKGGSYSLGSDQSDFFLDGLQFIINYIEDQFTREVLYPALASNWAGIDLSKFKLRGLNLNKKASEQFATILKTLIDGGLIKVQESDEKKIREMYDLPEIEEDRDEEEDDNEPEPSDSPEEPTEDEVEEELPEAEENALMNMKPIDVITFWNTPKQRDKYIDQEVESLTKYSKASLRIIADKLLSSIRWQLSNSKPQAQGLKEVKLNKNAVNSYKKNMGQRLSAIIKKAWENAEKKSKPHLENLAVNPNQLPNKVLTAFVVNQSDLAVEKQVTNMKDQSLLIANTASTKGYGLEQTLAQVEAGMDDFIASGNNAELANSTAVTQATSYGEMQYYKSIDDKLWGYRFENVAPKTNICQSCVGKTYRTGSSAMEEMSPPLHYRCKSFYEPIYKDEEKPDQLDDYIPAPSIMKEKSM